MMDIITKIKEIKKSRLTSSEKDLIMLFDEMTVSVNNSAETLYKYKNTAIFRLRHNTKLFAVNKKFWVGFGQKHNLNYDETQRVINDMVHSYLGLKRYVVTKGFNF